MKTLVKMIGMLVLVFALAGCPTYVVRDAALVKMDYSMVQEVTEQSAVQLETMRNAPVCECIDGVWNTLECRNSAKMYLFLTVRMPWHLQMMQYNSGLLEERPSVEPPVIPELETLCK